MQGSLEVRSRVLDDVVWATTATYKGTWTREIKKDPDSLGPTEIWAMTGWPNRYYVALSRAVL